MADAAAPLKVLVLNQISPSGLARLPADRYTVGTDLADPDAVLLRSADMHRRRHPGQRARHRPRRRRHQQHPGEGDERARRAGVQRAGRQRQRGQGAGARRHAAGGAQPAGGARASSPRSTPKSPDLDRSRRGRQEGLRRLRAGRPDARHRRPRQDRLPGRRRGHQARHGRARLRPRDHRRRRLEPAVAGAPRGERRRRAAAGRLRHAARAAGRGDAPPRQRRQPRHDEARARCCSTSRARAWSTSRRSLAALDAGQLGWLRLRLPRRRRWPAIRA